MISILSNINLDSVVRKVKKFVPCTESVGYGNVIEALVNPDAEVNSDSVETVFVIMDLREYLSGGTNDKDRICAFFEQLEMLCKKEKRYFISDGEYYLSLGCDQRLYNKGRNVELLWNTKLTELMKKKENVAVFPLSDCVKEVGARNFYSSKTWYLGNVRYSLDGAKEIVSRVRLICDQISAPAKKVLALDLDNTLWGGVAGEEGPLGIVLGESGIGKAYRDFQESILELKESGTVLVIVSKNNIEDVDQVFAQNPQMFLKKEDFTIIKANWELKSKNIADMAKELNVGLDSIVFVDDNPVEREEVSTALPVVECPQFPEAPEQLLEFAISLNETYFKKWNVTDEDKQKSKQYEAKAKIEKLQQESVDFEGFLKGLSIVLTRRDASENIERTVQLLQKTNQFNTTVKRYSYQEICDMMEQENWKLFLYEVEDKFSNHGLCALAVVSVNGERAKIDNFVMSCRVMGRNIEFGVLEDIERTLKEQGVKFLDAEYLTGQKNKPVEQLYEKAGFTVSEEREEGKKYELLLETLPLGRYIGEIKE